MTNQECDNNHDCEHCDWTECPLEVETDGDLISLDFMKKLGATCIATRNEKGELVAISSIDNLPSAEKTDGESK